MESSGDKTVHIAAGELFALATDAIEEDDRFAASTISSVYSGRLEPAVSDTGLCQADIAERLLHFGIDATGQPIGDRLLFADLDEARAFHTVSYWSRLIASNVRVALWDYNGGTSCLVINCTAGDEIPVLAEEYAVRKIGRPGDEVLYQRLRGRWALGRWSNDRQVPSNIGLIPKAWLVSKSFYEHKDNKPLFDATWYLGNVQLSVARKVLLGDMRVQRPGLFVIASPIWINPDPRDHRPFVLIMLADRPKEEQRKTAEKPVQPSKAQKTEERETPGKYAVHMYAVNRDAFGRYRVFGHEHFATLYDLVYHYMTHESALPCPLICGPPRADRDLVPDCAVPAPWFELLLPAERLPMNSERWAAVHFDQVIEPSRLNELYGFIVRSVFDPTDVFHRMWARLMGHNDPYKLVKTPATTSSEESPGKAIDFMNLNSPAHLQLDMKNLEYDENDTLGKGAFGSVFKGTYKPKSGAKIPVAIKLLGMSPALEGKRLSWIAEIETLYVLNHPNAVRFYGFLPKDDKMVMLVTEFMSGGSLIDFLKVHVQTLSENARCDILAQITRGMAHMHALDPPIVHGDLAARNCLMRPHPTQPGRHLVKVADFGLSSTTRRLLYSIPEQLDKLPFPWLAPEMLRRHESTTAADIWAFGVTAAEVCGCPEYPYALVQKQALLQFLHAGCRMNKPPFASANLYLLMLHCWAQNPADRPSFVQLEKTLVSLHIECESQPSPANVSSV